MPHIFKGLFNGVEKVQQIIYKRAPGHVFGPELKKEVRSFLESAVLRKQS
jgi:hypothetical protein